MKLNLDDLRRHYASLSDEALREIDRTELVDAARECYDQESAQRKPAPTRAASTGQPAARVTPLDPKYEEESEAISEDAEIPDNEDPPEWVAEADCVCTFASRPGDTASSDADNIRAVLEDAGIPCHVAMRTLDVEAAPRTQVEYRVMVPGGLNLEATTILDKEIYNPEVEALWRSHLEVLTDEQFFELKKEVILGGLLDRIERVERVYDEEVTRRTNARDA